MRAFQNPYLFETNAKNPIILSHHPYSLSPHHPIPTLKPSNSKTFKPSPPTTSHYNSLIRTHIESHHPKQALCFFTTCCSQTHLCSLTTSPFHCSSRPAPRSLLLKKPSKSTASYSMPTPSQHTNLTSTYAECGNSDDPRLVFDRLPDRNTVTWNSMMDGFLKCGDVRSAVRRFDEMRLRNIASWNSLLRGYVKENMSREALLLFLELRISGLKPDESTMLSLVIVVSDLGLADLGRIAHWYITMSEFSFNGALGVGLITMYSKCGSIDAAYKVFLAIQLKNVGHWTCMIGSLANHGRSEVSLRVFSEMLQCGIRPNYITFIGVLNACRHAGLAEEGLKYFNLIRSFNIEPRIKHYGCLVYLLGHSGLVEAAMEIACNLPTDPGFVVWGTLLAACRNHGNVEIAETVTKKLVELCFLISTRRLLNCLDFLLEWLQQLGF